MPFGDKVPSGGWFLPESYLIRGQKYLRGRTASASSCWVISLMARSMRSVFFISGSSSICALKLLRIILLNATRDDNQ